MKKYEWTKRQVEVATKEYPPDSRKYIDAFLTAVKEAGEGLTRTKFFELFEACGPGEGESVDYFDYPILADHWVLSADFSEAWDIETARPLARIATKAFAGKTELPADFCSLGGVPDWIQNQKFPICPTCDCDMVLFLQLKSLPYEITKKRKTLSPYQFGDAGNFYLFQCQTCGSFRTSEECH